jgi:hypothetical protein
MASGRLSVGEASSIEPWGVGVMSKPRNIKRGSEIVCITAILLAVCVSGCGRPSGGESEQRPRPAGNDPSSDEDHSGVRSANGAMGGADVASASAAVVAPIFDHGEGMADTHRDYAFLSEEEALQILKDELTPHGIALISGRVLEGVDIAGRHQTQVVEGRELRPIGEPKLVKDGSPEPLRATGIDPKGAVVVKFISEKEYEKLGGYFDSQFEYLNRDGTYRGGRRFLAFR